MIGATWNLRGIGKIEKQRFLRETLIEKRIDFIGLQETLKSDFSAQDLANIDNKQLFLWHWSALKGRSGGILVGIRKSTFDVHEHQSSDHFVRILLTDKILKFRWNLVIVYGAAQNEGKVDFLTDWSHMCHDSKVPLLVGR